MNMPETLALLVLTGVLTACGDNASELDKKSANVHVNENATRRAEGSFNIEAEGLLKFDHLAAKASSFNYRNDYWEFKAGGSKFRMAGRFIDDTADSSQESLDLEHNNIYLEFLYPIQNKTTRVSCKAAKQPKGKITRTIHADLSSSGQFNIELVLCRNTYTSEEIATISTPFRVQGQFKNVVNKKSLF